MNGAPFRLWLARGRLERQMQMQMQMLEADPYGMTNKKGKSKGKSNSKSNDNDRCGAVQFSAVQCSAGSGANVEWIKVAATLVGVSGGVPGGFSHSGGGWRLLN